MPTNEQLQAAHDLLVAADKESLNDVLPKLTAFAAELDTTLSNMLEPSPSAPISSFVKKVRDNVAGAAQEAQYLLDQFPKDE